ncbi:MAG: SMP-30/gluconolactonase/LRE family protein [Aquabacterium sp.]
MNLYRLRAPALWRACALGALSLLATTCSQASDSGLPDCPGVGPARVLLEKQGPLESIAFDTSRRLLFTNMTQKALKRLDAPTAAPVTVATGLSSPGGIAVVNAHEAYVGTGNSLNGLIPGLGLAGIAHVDLDTGTVTPYAKGLSMSNGMVRAQDGTFYASDDLAKSLDRVLPDGTVQRGWLALNSNGMVLSPDQKTLYVNQMQPAKVFAIDRATSAIRLVAEAPPARTWTWLDGLDVDSQGRLYVVAYWAGEIWRVEPGGQMCLLTKGLSLPSAVAVGQSGNGYAASSVYITTHSGRLHEVPNAVP